MGAGRGLGTGPSLVSRGRTLNTVTLPRHTNPFLDVPLPLDFFFRFNFLLIVPPATGSKYSPASPGLFPLSLPSRNNPPLCFRSVHIYSFFQVALRVPTGIAMSTAETFSSSTTSIYCNLPWGIQGRGCNLLDIDYGRPRLF